MQKIYTILLSIYILPLAALSQTLDIPNTLPQADNYGNCYARATLPDLYEYAEKKVMTKPARTEIINLPPVYNTIEEQVLVKEASVEYITIPAEYETVTEQVVVKDETKTIREKYDENNNVVLTSPEYGQWSQMIKDPNCFSENPEDCYLVKWQHIAAQYDTLKTKQLRQMTTDDKPFAPTAYKTITKRVMKTPARVVEREIPAVYENIKRQVLIQPARIQEVNYPAEYSTVQERVLIKSGGERKWVQILCPQNLSATRVKQLQLALQSKGYYKNNPVDGILGAKTKAALKAYQEFMGFPLGNLNQETLSSLGISL